MTEISTKTDIAAVLLAGRRAWVSEMQAAASTSPNICFVGKEPMAYGQDDPLFINGINITSWVDAVTMEAIVRLQHPERPQVKRRAWWRFW